MKRSVTASRLVKPDIGTYFLGFWNYVERYLAFLCWYYFFCVGECTVYICSVFLIIF